MATTRLQQALRDMGESIRPGQRLFETLTAQRMNAIMDAIRGLANGENLVCGPGLLKRQVQGQYTLRTDVKGKSGSGVDYPFDPSVSGGVVTFYPGTINGRLPSNYKTGVAVTGTKYISLSCTTNAGQITVAEFVAEAAQPGSIAPTLGVPPSSFKVLVAIYDGGDLYKVWGNSNMLATSRLVYRAQKDPPVAGQVPYDDYYTWEVSET